MHLKPRSPGHLFSLMSRLLITSSTCFPEFQGMNEGYQLQRAVVRLQLKDKLDILVRVLQYGKEKYGRLSLDKQDADTFRRITSPHQHHNQQMALGILLGQPITATLTTDEQTLETLRVLVEDYDFNVNYSRFSVTTGITSLDVNEGYRVFLTAIQTSNARLTKSLLDYGASTHMAKPISITNQRRGLYGADMNAFFMDRARLTDFPNPISYVNYFPADLRPYLRDSADALIMAVHVKNVEITLALLEHDLERWDDAEGGLVLKQALQLAVDDNWADGIPIIRGYINEKDREQKVKKSPSALKKLLVDAVATDNLEEVKRLIKQGARFETPATSDIFYRSIDIFRSIVRGRKTDILAYLIKSNYPGLDQFRLGEMLIQAVESSNMDIVNLLLSQKTRRPKIYEKTIRRAMIKGNFEAFSALLKLLKEQEPFNVIAGWRSLLRVAEKRKYDRKDPEGFFLSRLQNLEKEIMANRADRISKARKGVKMAIVSDDEDLASDDEEEFVDDEEHMEDEESEDDEAVYTQTQQKQHAIAAESDAESDFEESNASASKTLKYAAPTRVISTRPKRNAIKKFETLDLDSMADEDDEDDADMTSIPRVSAQHSDDDDVLSEVEEEEEDDHEVKKRRKAKGKQPAASSNRASSSKRSRRAVVEEHYDDEEEEEEVVKRKRTRKSK
ncbi:hypothetical protein SmJEL517_g03148 [Synchytrium microbalum]|uniref:Uncharacterized protein n=1 Tax=Synchytrium microbalum TaxID=1806994 RepID=A0A507C525_9FUNG|nr:uncharacterized protein SmJEL517_g03148 [Synchytrium microbalum]TPX34219.1 hypothetical protein SmJEL517_g03148 [Synchytrium microbalum]